MTELVSAYSRPAVAFLADGPHCGREVGRRQLAAGAEEQVDFVFANGSQAWIAASRIVYDHDYRDRLQAVAEAAVKLVKAMPYVAPKEQVALAAALRAAGYEWEEK